MSALSLEADERPSYGEVMTSVRRTKASLEDAAEEIIWQIEHAVWEVLGHPDWNAMREAVYGGAAFMVPTAERPELVARMRRSGLTQQEIADTAGVSLPTVKRDLNGSHEPLTDVTITNARGQQRPASYETRPSEVEQAVAEFPDLAYYAETGRASDVVLMAGDLHRYAERGELELRLDILRRSIALDRSKRDGTYQPIQPEAVPVCPTCGQTVRSTP